MRDVQVTADDDRLFLVEGMKIVAKGILPRHAVVDALQAVLCVRGVAGEQEKFRVFQRDDAAFMVEIFRADAVDNIHRRVFRKDRRAGVALFLGGIPELLIAGQFQRHLMRLRLGFLQTEKVGVHHPENFLKPLLQAGADAVDIP